jgi:protein involved in polysaccharide export with SLBB domain
MKFQMCLRCLSNGFVLLSLFGITIHAQNVLPVKSAFSMPDTNAVIYTQCPWQTPQGDTVMRFQSGDALKIITYPNSDSFPNGIRIIDNDGYCDLPIVGFTKVTSMTPQQLEKILLEKYAAYLPRLNLVVRPLYRVSLLGGFYKPGLYLVDPRESMWNVIERAGGTQREDGLTKIRWEHAGTIVTNNILPYYQTGQSLYSIGFKSGDQLRVTQKPKMELGDVFRNDIVPVFSLLISVASVYVMYETYSVRAR